MSLKSMIYRPASKVLGRRALWLINYYRFYLIPKGWLRSVKALESVGSNGEPVPWITYSARTMLDRIASLDLKVFEYGAGNSSLWWAARVQTVVSVEHDPEWASKIAARAPNNMTIICTPRGAAVDPSLQEHIRGFFDRQITPPSSGSPDNDIYHGFVDAGFEAYALEMARYPQGTFDVVVVDGMARNLCTWLAARFVKPEGIIVFDNSERWQYNDAYSILRQHGFCRIDFYGTGPINAYEWSTSIFVKSLELLRRNTLPSP